ncbi:MAG: class I SAM-dependent methyltransferase [Kofleriaceae bacterium]
MTNDDIARGYAPVARGYREQLGGELAGKPLDRAFLIAFAERCRGPIVDVGCGPGHVTRFLADHGADARGIDIAPAMIAEAKASYPDLPFEVGDMAAITGSIAGIVAFYSIVHTDDLATPFAGFRRALELGGLVAIAFHIGTERVVVDEMFGEKTHLEFVFHEPAKVIAALEASGFVIEARLDRAPYPAVEHQSQRCYLLARAI